jgi:hypothetical protein
MPPKTSPAVTRSKTPARQTTTAKAAPAPPQEPQPEQVYAGLFGGGGGAFGSNFGNLSGSYGTPTGTDQRVEQQKFNEHAFTQPGAVVTPGDYEYHIQWRSGNHDGWMEAGDIPTTLLIKFHTERFQKEMRAESRNGWCKQPPFIIRSPMCVTHVCHSLLINLADFRD